MRLLCPCCAGKQFCPCENCCKFHEQKIVWKWVTPNGPIACGHCGFTMSCDDWMLFEYEFFEDVIKVNLAKYP